MSPTSNRTTSSDLSAWPSQALCAYASTSDDPPLGQVAGRAHASALGERCDGFSSDTSERANIGRLVVARALYGLAFQVWARQRAASEAPPSPQVDAWLTHDLRFSRASCLCDMGLRASAERELQSLVEDQASWEHIHTHRTWIMLSQLRMQACDLLGSVDAAARGCEALQAHGERALVRLPVSLRVKDRCKDAAKAAWEDLSNVRLAQIERLLQPSSDEEEQWAINQLALSVVEYAWGELTPASQAAVRWYNFASQRSSDLLGPTHATTLKLQAGSALFSSENHLFHKRWGDALSEANRALKFIRRSDSTPLEVQEYCQQVDRCRREQTRSRANVAVSPSS